MAQDDDRNGNGQLVLDSRTKTKKPSMYKVIMLNDDYTPMEFVVHVLQHFFGHSTMRRASCTSARRWGVRHLCFEVAESKAQQTMHYAARTNIRCNWKSKGLDHAVS